MSVNVIRITDITFLQSLEVRTVIRHTLALIRLYIVRSQAHFCLHYCSQGKGILLIIDAFDCIE